VQGPLDESLDDIEAAGWKAGWKAGGMAGGMVTYDPVVDIFAIDGTDPSTSGEFPSHD
jgi:hypothetical protein